MRNGWQNKALGDVLEKTETTDPTHSPHAEFDYIDVSSISNKTFTIQETQRLKGKDAPSRARRIVKTNDVLFATIRPTLQRIAVVPPELDSQVCSTGYFVLRAKPTIDFRFIFYFLQTDDFMTSMEQLQKGASYPAVTDNDVRSQFIPIPSMTEQRQIVKALDEAFADLAIAQANTEKNFQNARALFESHLQFVFTRRGKGWVEKRLGELSRINYGYTESASSDKIGPHFLRITDIQDNHVDWTTVPYCRIEKADLPKYKLAHGDIVFARTGATTGKSCLVSAPPDAVFASYLIRVQVTGNELSPQFLNLFFQTSSYWETIRSGVSGSAQGGFNATKLGELKIPFPSAPKEQQKVVTELDALAAETQRLARIYDHKQKTLAVLKKSLLHQAFTGELTKQSPQYAVAQTSINFPAISSTDLHAGILAMAYQQHERAHRESIFGHVKAEKIAHIIESDIGIELGRVPLQDAAGPNDYPHLMKVEHRAKMAGFFDFQRIEGAGYRIKKLRRFDELINKTRTALAERVTEVDRVLGLFLNMDTQQSEIFATVYAAWNNLLLDGKHPSDEDIVREARENWHPDKLKIPRDKFFKAIIWMRKINFIPKGQGKKVLAKVQ